MTPVRFTHDEFVELAQQAFDSLPDRFRTTIENVHIVVEERDGAAARRRAGVRPGGMLLGLYEGVPLTRRGTEYGAVPVIPDRITLYQRNIEDVCSSREEIREAIRDTIIHEVAHYFGMNEKEVRKAGY